jgi:glycosyltransferase involved in cell wall biosynthesis
VNSGYFATQENNQSTPLKIIHLANHILEIGNGIVNVVIDLACSQADAGHNVIVASAGGEHEAVLAEHGVKHVYIEQRPHPHKILSMFWKFNRLVMRENPDVVHAHMMTGMLIAKAVRLGRSYRIVSTVHNVFQRTAKLMGMADKVVAVSASVQKTMILRGIPASRMLTIENGTIASPRRKPDAVHAAVAELVHPNVVTIAGMYERKGIAVLMDAFSRIERDKQAHLYVIGDGPDRKQFEQLMVKYAMYDRVHFLGFQTDAAAFLKQTDIFALASFTDSCPLVISEAREAGCAIVGSNVDGIPQALDFGEAGMLFEPGNVGELTNALNTLLDDPTLRAEWAKRASANLDRLNVSRVSQEYLAIYAQAAKRFVTQEPRELHMSKSAS